MHIVEDIDGVTVCRALATPDSCELTLLAASGFNETGFFPAESLRISSLSGVAAIRDICERLIEAHLALSQEVE